MRAWLFLRLHCVGFSCVGVPWFTSCECGRGQVWCVPGWRGRLMLAVGMGTEVQSIVLASDAWLCSLVGGCVACLGLF